MHPHLVLLISSSHALPQLVLHIQTGEKYIYSVLNYSPLSKSVILLVLVVFIATPLIYTGLFFWARLFLWLSGEGVYLLM